ncbi:MAG: glycoside-pentoside-hexuronide (GPH):cation symporter [Maricaulaceae bacterium]
MAAYGAGDFGLNFYWQSVGFFLLFFYTDILGLSNTVAGAVYAVGGLVDALSDPTMGIIADRARTRKGRYRPYLLYGAIPLGLSFILLFTAPLIVSAPFMIAVAVISHIFFRICYTAVSIPYGTLGTRITFDAHERTRLAGTRMLFGALGGVCIMYIVTQLRASFDDSQAIILTSFIAAIVGSILIFFCYAQSVEKRILSSSSYTSTSRNYSLRKIIPLIFTNRPFLILVAATFLLTIANMIIIKTIIYRFDYILNATQAGGMAIVIMTLIPLFTIPLWVWLYLCLSKRTAFVAGCITVIIGLIALFLTGETSIIKSIISYGLIAAGFSSFAVGFWSVLPDTIDYGHWKSGHRIESGLVGLASALQKIAIAIAGLGVGIALDIFNYNAGEVQSLNTLNTLHIFSTILPLILMLLCAAIFMRYPLSAPEHSRIVKHLKPSTHPHN